MCRLNVSRHIMFAFKVFTTQTTTKLSVVRMYQLMTYPFHYGIKHLFPSKIANFSHPVYFVPTLKFGIGARG